jgi:hypothetical protein
VEGCVFGVKNTNRADNIVLLRHITGVRFTQDWFNFAMAAHETVNMQLE